MAESSSSTDNLIRNINLDHDFEDLNVDESSQNSIDINGDNNDLTRFQEVSQNVNYANDDDAVLVDVSTVDGSRALNCAIDNANSAKAILGIIDSMVPKGNSKTGRGNCHVRLIKFLKLPSIADLPNSLPKTVGEKSFSSFNKNDKQLYEQALQSVF